MYTVQYNVCLYIKAMERLTDWDTVFNNSIPDDWLIAATYRVEYSGR